MSRAISISKRMAKTEKTAAITKGKIIGASKVKRPKRNPTNTTQAETIALMVVTPLNRPSPVPTFPFSDSSMDRVSLSGIKKWEPRDWINRNTSITP